MKKHPVYMCVSASIQYYTLHFVVKFGDFWFLLSEKNHPVILLDYLGSN